MTEHDAIQVPASELAELRKDAERLDYLEAEANREPILLHAKMQPPAQCRGLGLGNLGRTLRQAIDQMQRMRIYKSK
jgi:hypothetical protein